MSSVVGSEAILYDRDVFDEAAYLRMYPDIALAITEGRERSAWNHFDRHGRAEGRKPFDFDSEFYLRSYPAAAQDIAAGLAGSPLRHYVMFGRGRGYVPTLRAPRPQNAAQSQCPFGGFWTDQANAFDQLQGRIECGRLTPEQGKRVAFWIANGYVVLEAAIPPHLVDAAAVDLEKAYAGGFEKLKFECHMPRIDGLATWQPYMNEHPAKALDIHHFSRATRNLIFSAPVAEFLGFIFDAKTFATQTLGFLRGSAQGGHQDSAYVPYTIPRQFAATWIALEDVTLGAGELFYYPGSHRFPDYLYLGGYKSIAEARRMEPDGKFGDQVEDHVRSLEQRAREAGIARLPFAAKKGDVLVWHSDLVHGGAPVSRDITRKSVVTHYCPKHVAPLFGEWLPTKIWEHDGHRFTTSHYIGMEPTD